MEEKKKYDSSYSIALAILEKMKGGGGSCKLQDATLAVWENGKYEVNPEPGFDGLSKAYVDVNIPAPVLEENKTLDITNNGSYTMTPSKGYDAIKMSTIHVNVPTGGAGPFKVASLPGMKLAYSAFKTFTNDDFDFSGVEDMSDMFHSCRIISIPLINTSSATNCSELFMDCDYLESIPKIDLSNCTDVSYLFGYCRNLTEVPLLNISKAYNTNSMFEFCSKLTTIPQLDFSHSQDVRQLFQYCYSLQSLPKLNFSAVNYIDSFFGGSDLTDFVNCGGFTGLKVDWNDNYGLARCPNLTKQSVINILTELADVKALGEVHYIKFNQKSIDLLADEDIKIATDKGWIVLPKPIIPGQETWGICGTMTGWASDSDIPMKHIGNNVYSASLTVTTEDMFKFRTDDSWSTQFGGGWETPLLEPNIVYTLSSAESVPENLKVAQAGTYDVLLDVTNKTCQLKPVV